MAIICSSYSTSISGSNSITCGYAIRIYDIRPLPIDSSLIVIQIDGGQTINVYNSYSAIQYGSVIFSLHLISKNTGNGTAVIDMVVSDNPCNGISCLDTCVGNDLYTQRCSINYNSQNIPTGYTCVPDIIKTPNYPSCMTTGSISCTSTPSGAQIWLDGINSGQVTPYTLTNISAQMHNITYKLTGYNDCGVNVTVTAGGTVNADCTLPINATHYIEYNFNIFPTTFNDLVSDSVIDLSTLLGNYLPFPSNIQYIESKFENNRFKIYVNYTEPVQLSMNLYNNYNINSMYELSISALAGIFSGLLILSIETIILTRLGPLAINPYTLGGAALIAVAGAFFTGWTIYNIPSSTSTTGTITITPEKQIADAEIEYNKAIAKCKADHPCALNNTCSVDEAKLYDSCMLSASIIQKVIDNNMAGTDPSTLQTIVNEELTRFSNRQTDLTNGLITVTQALADLAAQIAAAEAEATALKAQVTCNTGFTYNPDTKQCVKIEECAIRNPFGGCILSSKTGTTLMYIGGGLLIGYIGYKIFVKK